MIRNAIELNAMSSVSLPVMSLADAGHGDEADHAPKSARLEMPDMNRHKGRELFAEQGCIACHAVCRVGGEDAVPLDAHSMDPPINAFGFSAKMWTMAPFIVEAQEEAFGEQILFTREELAHVIAFLDDDAKQHQITEGSLSPEIRKMMNHSHGAHARRGSAQKGAWT